MRKVVSILGVLVGSLAVASAQTCVETFGQFPNIRSGGEAELVNTFIVQCPAAVSIYPSFDAFLSINSGTDPITSRAGEAILSLSTPGGSTIVYPGTLSTVGTAGIANNQLNFTGVAIPTSAFSFTVSGVRVNASPMYIPLNAGGFGEVIGFFGTANAFLPITTVGDLILATILAPLAPNTATPMCTATGLIPPGSIFPIRIGENFPGAFKVQLAAPGIDSETGLLPVPASLTATSATQFEVTLSNIPSGVTLYVPLTITSDAGGTARLVIAEGSVTPATSSTIQGGITVVPVTSSVFYNVTAINPSITDTFTVPVYLGAASSTTYPSIPTYSVQLAPIGTDFAMAVPRFDLSTALNAPLFSSTPCNTVTFTFTPLATSLSSQTVTLSGATNASYFASATVGWISVSPTSGTLPAQLTISVNPGSLPPGTYNGVVNISSSALVTPSSIPVQLIVTQRARVTLLPGALAFVGKGSQIVSVSGLLSGNAFTATAFGSPWLSLAQTGDSNNGTIIVNTDPTGLQPGTYRGAIQVTAGVSTETIPVSMIVGTVPALVVSPTSLSFVIQLGASGVTQSLAISGLSTTSSFSSGSSWLLVAQTSSTGLLQVTANPTGLSTGSYHGFIDISSGTSSLRVPVLLHVGAVAPPVLGSITSGVTFQQVNGSPGLFISLFGTGLGPASGATAVLGADGLLSNLIGDTRVLADGVPCTMLFANGAQVNAILPFGVAGQASTSVQVEYLGVSSNAITVPLQPATPGLFTAGATGSGGVAALNQDGSINSAFNPAAAGSEVVLFGAGGGVLNPRTPDGSLSVAPYPAPVLPLAVTIGGLGTTIAYGGSAPGEITGVLQINVGVPLELTAGPQPVILFAGTYQSQQNAVIYIQ